MILKRVLLVLAAAVALAAGALAGIVATVDPNDYRDDITALVEDATGRRLVVGGPIELSFGLITRLQLIDISLENVSWGSRSQMATARRVSVATRLLPLLRGEVVLEDAAVEGADVIIETDASGRGNWIFAAAEQTASGSGTPVVPLISQAVVSDSTIRYRDGATGAEYSVDIGSAFVAGGPASRLTVRGKGRFQEQSVDLELQAGPVAALLAAADRRAPWPFRVRLVADAGVLEATGEINPPEDGKDVALQFELELGSAENLVRLGGSGAVPLAGLAASGRLSGGGTAWAVDGLRLRHGDTRLGGSLGVDLSAKPRIEALLDAPIVDLTPFMSGDGASGDKAAAPRLFPDNPLPFGMLGAADMKASVTIGRLQAATLVISDLAADVTLGDGRLAIALKRAGLAGGHLSGDAAVSAPGGRPTVSVAVKADKIALGKLLAQWQVTDIVELDVGGTVTAVGAGGSVREIMSGLNGYVETIGGKGKIDTGLVDLFGADLFQRIAPWSQQSIGSTAVNCVVARYDIKGGIARDDGILMDTSNVTIAGKGQIDLRSETVDLQFAPKPKEASLVSLAVPVNVTGPLADPSIRPDEASVAKGVAAVVGSLINPLVILVPLVSMGSDDKNPCLAALAASGAAPPEPVRSTAPAPASPKAAPKGEIERAVDDVGKAIDRGLKGLFGR